VATDPIALLLEQMVEGIEGLKGDDKAAYDDLEFYSRYVIGYGNPDYKSNSRFLRKIYQELQYSTDEEFLILGPRQSAKSQAVTITYTTWSIGRNPLLRFLLAFASMDVQGLAFARQLDQIISGNERYIKIFGQLKPDKPEKWDAKEKIVSRDTPPGGLKDPTISVVGLGSAVPSKRADVIICDDLVTGENAYSPALRKMVSSFVKQSLMPILVPGGKTIVVGSRWDPRDIYAELSNDWGKPFPRTVPIDTKILYDKSGGDAVTEEELEEFYDDVELSPDEKRETILV
jgi:hypothetical protein